jgi:hypothetical protein
LRKPSRGRRRPIEGSQKTSCATKEAPPAAPALAAAGGAAQPAWRASRPLRRRSTDRHGRGVDYSIALLERLSAFFIMLIGFEGRPRLTPRRVLAAPPGARRARYLNLATRLSILRRLQSWNVSLMKRGRPTTAGFRKMLSRTGESAEFPFPVHPAHAPAQPIRRVPFV